MLNIPTATLTNSALNGSLLKLTNTLIWPWSIYKVDYKRGYGEDENQADLEWNIKCFNYWDKCYKNKRCHIIFNLTQTFSNTIWM